jgi:glycosyltransferase involved in cell wall biosynthesis
MMKPELLIISHTYVRWINRRKLEALGQYFNVTCATASLSDEAVYGRPLQEIEEAAIQESVQVYRFAQVPPKAHFTRVFYRGLSNLFRTRRFDFILVESEPWAFLKWQAWLLAKVFQSGATFGEFSWENLERSGLTGVILSLVYRLSAIVEDFSISGNQASSQIFVKHGTPPERNLVAPQLGVETKLFHPVSHDEKLALRRRMNLPADAFIVGFCGRLTAEKGVRELHEAVARLRDQSPQLQLAFLGNGPLAPELAAIRSTWVHLLSSRPHFEIPPFMQALDLFVLPSKPVRERGYIWEEQFGHVLIEAMACGTPTLGSDSGAIPSVLGNPDAIFHHSDAEAIYEKLEHALESPDWLARLAHGQRIRVQNCYSHQAVARTYAEFLCRVRRVKEKLVPEHPNDGENINRVKKKSAPIFKLCAQDRHRKN